MKTIRVIGLNLFLSALVIALSAGIFWLDVQWFAPLPAAFEIAGWALMAVGTLVVLAAVVSLARHSGASAAPGDPTLHLVTTGLYR